MADKKDEAEKEEKKEGAEGEAAEGAEGAEGEGSGKKKLGKKKLIIIIAVAVVVLLGGAGAALYFTGIIGGAQTEEEAAKAEEKKSSGESVFYDLGDILVNLSGEGKRPVFLKVKVSLEIESEKDRALMDQIKPRILDNFQIYLRELRMEDLKGSAGIYRLREELLMRVTEAAHPVRVRDVLFQEILVQ